MQVYKQKKAWTCPTEEVSGKRENGEKNLARNFGSYPGNISLFVSGTVLLE